MRTIKFRAWDKKLNVMWEPIELVKLLKYLTFQQMPNADAYMAFKDHPNDLVWLEFTGITDKNGIEIYEGDIVKQCWGGNCAIDQVEDMGFDLKSSLLDSGGTVEVIGNIYENKELLK